MARYHYVPSKRDLLNLMLDTSHAEFEWPAKQMRDWRAVLSHFAWESRRWLKQHPWVGLLQASDPEYGPECIRVLELLLLSLSQVGLDVRTAIRIIGVLFVFVNGFVAAESSSRATSKGERMRPSASQPSFSKAILATGDYPHVQQLVDIGAELPDDEGFTRALDWILNGIASEIKPQLRARPTKQKKRA